MNRALWALALGNFAIGVTSLVIAGILTPLGGGVRCIYRTCGAACYRLRPYLRGGVAATYRSYRQLVAPHPAAEWARAGGYRQPRRGAVE